jgi:hypothetical protein
MCTGAGATVIRYGLVYNNASVAVDLRFASEICAVLDR